MSRTPEELFDILKARIEERSALVGVIGMGYVGLPLAFTFAARGFPVLGFDVDDKKIDALARKVCYIDHLSASLVEEGFGSGRLDATTDFDRLAEPDALLICVPTPLTPHREPDMRFVEKTAQSISTRLRPGQLVILESTTYPGTTDGLVKDILETSGLQTGRDFFLAFSPEREDPGNPDFGTSTIPKVVGGVTPPGGELAVALYAQVIDRVVPVANARVAEASKLTENIFRAVNIALVNELKIVYEKMDIDVWDVLDAAATKPFGFMRFTPGPGWGGHCIPVDPFYLSWKAREHGVTPKFIELAGEVNVRMPEYVVDKLQVALNERRKAINGSRIMVLGLAYKKNIDDPRESPSFEIIEHLLKLGADLSYHDPHIAVAPSMRSWPSLPPLESVPLDPDVVRSQDAIVIVTDHSKVDYDMLAANAQLIVDTRGIYRDPMPNVVKA